VPLGGAPLGCGLGELAKWRGPLLWRPSRATSRPSARGCPLDPVDSSEASVLRREGCGLGDAWRCPFPSLQAKRWGTEPPGPGSCPKQAQGPALACCARSRRPVHPLVRSTLARRPATLAAPVGCSTEGLIDSPYQQAEARVSLTGRSPAIGRGGCQPGLGPAGLTCSERPDFPVAAWARAAASSCSRGSGRPPCWSSRAPAPAPPSSAIQSPPPRRQPQSRRSQIEGQATRAPLIRLSTACPPAGGPPAG